MPQISMLASSAGTKGLLEGDKPLEKEGTTLQVYDYLSGDGISINGKGEGYYIDNTLTFKGSTDGSSSDGKWQFPGNRKYYWTKTGTHKFFGYLTQDGTLTYPGTTDWDAAKQTLLVSEFELTPDKAQFDFSYSEIVTRDASKATDRIAVPLNLNHLFTALAVDVVNETGEPLKSFTLTLGDVNPTQSATINWGTSVTVEGKTLPTVTYTSKGLASMALGAKEIPVATEAAPQTQFFNGDAYRLLWPQDITESKLDISYYIEDAEVKDGKVVTAVTVDLKDVFGTDVNTLAAGHKYLLKIKVTLTEVLFKVIVDPLDEKYYDGQGESAKYTDYLIKLI